MNPETEKVIVQVVPENTVTITLNEYRTLIGKSALYDAASAIYACCSYPNKELQTVLNCEKAAKKDGDGDAE